MALSLALLLLPLLAVTAATAASAGGGPEGQRTMRNDLRGPLHFSQEELTGDAVGQRFRELMSAQRTQRSADGIANFLDVVKQRSGVAAAQGQQRQRRSVAGRQGQAFAMARNAVALDRQMTDNASSDVLLKTENGATRTPAVSILSTEPSGYIGYGGTLSSLLLLGRFDEVIVAVYVDGVPVQEFEIPEESPYALRIARIPEYPDPPEACLFVVDPAQPASPVCGAGGVAESPVSIKLTVALDGTSEGGLVNVTFLLDGLQCRAWLARRSDHSLVLLAVRSPVAVMEAFAPFDPSLESSAAAIPGDGGVSATAAEAGNASFSTDHPRHSPNRTLVWGDGAALSARNRRSNQQLLLRQYRTSSVGAGQRVQEEEAKVSRIAARMGRITYSGVREWIPGHRTGFDTSPYPPPAKPSRRPTTRETGGGNASDITSYELPAFAVVSPHIIPAEGFSANITLVFAIGETTGDLLTSASALSLSSRRDRYSLTRLLPTLTNTAMVQSMPVASRLTRNGLRFVNLNYMYTVWYHTLEVHGAFPRTTVLGSGVRVQLHPVRFPTFSVSTDWYVEVDRTSGDCQLLSASNTAVSCEVTLTYADYYHGYPTYTTDAMESCGGGVVVSVSVGTDTATAGGELGAAVQDSIRGLSQNFPLVSPEETLFKPDNLLVSNPGILLALQNVSRALQAQQQEAGSGSATTAVDVGDLSVTFLYSFVYQNRYSGDYRLHCHGSHHVSVDVEASGDLTRDRNTTSSPTPPARAASRATAPAQEDTPPPLPPRRRHPARRRVTSRPPRNAVADGAEILARQEGEEEEEWRSAIPADAAARDLKRGACEVLTEAPLRNTRSNTTLSYAAFAYFNVSCTYPLSHLLNRTLRGSLFCGVSLEGTDIFLAADSSDDLGGGGGGGQKQPLGGSVVVFELSVPFSDGMATEAEADEGEEEEDLMLRIDFDATNTHGDGFVTVPVPRVSTAADCLLASTELYWSTVLVGRRWWTGPGGGGIPILPNDGGGDGARCSFFLTLPLDHHAPSSVCGGDTITTPPSPLAFSLHHRSTPGSPGSSSAKTAFMDGIRTQLIYCGSRTYFMDPITVLQVRVPLGFVPLLVDLDSLAPRAEDGLLVYHYCVEVEFEERGEGRPSAMQLPMRSANGTFTGGPLIYTLVDTSESTSDFTGWVRASFPPTDDPEDARRLGEVQYYFGSSLLYFGRGGAVPADADDVAITGRDVTIQLAPIEVHDCMSEAGYGVSPSAYLPFLSGYILNETTVAVNISADVPGGWYNFTMLSSDIGELWVDCGLSLRVNFSVTGVTAPDFSPVGGGVTVTIRGHNLPMWASGELYVALGLDDDDSADGSVGESDGDAAKPRYYCGVTYTSPEEIRCTTPPMEPDEVRRLSLGNTEGTGYYALPVSVSLYLEPVRGGGYELFQEITTRDFPDGESWFFIPYQIIEAVVTDVSPRRISCMNPEASITITGTNIQSRNILVCRNSGGIGGGASGSEFYDGCTLCLPRTFSETVITCYLLDALDPDTYHIFLSDQVTTPVPNFTIVSACTVTELLPRQMYAYGSDELIMQGTDFHPGAATEMTVRVQSAVDDPFGATLRTYTVPIIFFNETTIVGRTPELGSWLTERATVRLEVPYGLRASLKCDLLDCGIRVIPPGELPVITSFSPLYGQAPLTLTVYGSGFRKLPSSPTYDLTVAPPPPRTGQTTLGEPFPPVPSTYIDVGHGPCRIVDALNTRLVCLLEKPCYNSYANSSLRLVASGRLGSTALSTAAAAAGGGGGGELFFLCTMSVTGVSPTRGSLGGGLPLTITGLGFPTDASVLKVTVGGFPCTITHVTVREIQCTTTPASGGSGSATGAVTVLNTATSSRSSCCSFTYDRDITPTITSVYPLIGVRSSRVTITGNNFLPSRVSSDGGKPYVDVRIGSYAAREENITNTVIRYNISQSVFISDTVAVFVPGVGLSAPYHIETRISEVTSRLYGSFPNDLLDSFATSDAATPAAAAAGSGTTTSSLSMRPPSAPSTSSSGDSDVCIDLPRIALLVAIAVTEPAVGGFQSGQLIRLVGTNLEANQESNFSDMFTVNVCGKPCEVRGTNADGDVLCVVPDYIDEEFIARFRSLLTFPTLIDGFVEYTWLPSWETETDGAGQSSSSSFASHDAVVALGLANTTLPMCSEEQDRVASRWTRSSLFLSVTPPPSETSTPVGTDLFLVLAAKMHSRLALSDVTLTFAPVTGSAMDLREAVCTLQLATAEAETLTLFASGASDPHNASMWRSDAEGTFTWPPLNIGLNTLSFTDRDTVPISSYVAVRCSGFPASTIVLKDATAHGYQVGLNPAGGECPVDMITARTNAGSGGGDSDATRSNRMHSCSSRIGQSCTTFRYDIDLTPVVTGFDRTAVLISDIGVNVTIHGVNFGDEVGEIESITLDRAMCLPVVVNDTAIVCSMLGRMYTDTPNCIVWRNERGRGLILAAQNLYVAVAWSSYLAWMGSGLPSDGQVVVLPAGNTVMLDTSPPPLSGMLLDGVLIVTDDYDVELTVGLLAITETGALIAGSAEAPRQHAFTLTMSEANSATTVDEVADMKNNTQEPPYTKLINVYGGALQLHGSQPDVLRCALAQDAIAGDSSVVLACRTTWRVGEEVAITASSLLAHETETRTIVSRQLVGATTTLILSEPLLYNHTMGLPSNEVSAAAAVPSRTGRAGPDGPGGGRVTGRVNIDGLPAWAADMDGVRKAVGGAVVVLLTRNVRIRGDARSETSAIGASLWVRGSATTFLSNVEVYRAGKLGSSMGFAVYLDGVKHATVKAVMSNCVMHHAYHRAVVLRQTQNVLVQGLFIIGVEGYGIAAIGTLHSGLAIRDNFVSSLYHSRGGVDDAPSGIFLTNAGVEVTGNEIVASEGHGLWYSLRSTFMTSMSRTCPALQPITLFENNTVYRIRRHGLFLFPYHFAMDSACATNLFDETAMTTGAHAMGGEGSSGPGDSSSSGSDGVNSAVKSGLGSGTPISCGLLSRSVFVSCGLHAVYLPPSSGYHLRRCVIADAGDAGVYMDYSHLPTVFEHSAMWGLLPNGYGMNFATGRIQRNEEAGAAAGEGQQQPLQGQRTESANEASTAEGISREGDSADDSNVHGKAGDGNDADNRTSVAGEGRVCFRARHGGRVDFVYVTFSYFLFGTALAFETMRQASNTVYKDSVSAYFIQSNVLGLTFPDYANLTCFTNPQGCYPILALSGPGVIHDMDGKLSPEQRNAYYFSDSLYMNSVPSCKAVLTEDGRETNYTVCYAASCDAQLVTVNPYPTLAAEVFDDEVSTYTTAGEGSEEERCNLMQVTVRYATASTTFTLPIPSNYSDNADLAPAFFFLAPQLRQTAADEAWPLGDAHWLSSSFYGNFLTTKDGELAFATEANITVRLFRTATATTGEKQSDASAGSVERDASECYTSLIHTTVYDAQNDGLQIWRTVTVTDPAALWTEFPTTPTLLQFAVHPRSYYFYARSANTVGGDPTVDELSSSSSNNNNRRRNSNITPSFSGAGAATHRVLGSRSSQETDPPPLVINTSILVDSATMQRTADGETLLSVLVDTHLPLDSTVRWVGTTWMGKVVTCPDGEECLGPYFPFLKHYAATAVALSLQAVVGEDTSLLSLSPSQLSLYASMLPFGLDKTILGYQEVFDWHDAGGWLDGLPPVTCPTVDAPVIIPATAPSQQLSTRQYVIPFGRRVVLRGNADVDGALLVFGELLVTSDPTEGGAEGSTWEDSSGPAMTVRVGSLAVFGRLTVKASLPSSRPIRILLGYSRYFANPQDYLGDEYDTCPTGALTVSCHDRRRPVRLDEGTVLRCGTFHASGTVRIIGYAPAPTVWRARGVARKGSRATPAMHSLFEPWQGESLLGTYNDLVPDAASRLPQWCTTVPVSSSQSSWDKVTTTPADFATGADDNSNALDPAAVVRRVWQKGDLIAATSTAADLNGGEVNTAATNAFFTLGFREYRNYTRILMEVEEDDGSGAGQETMQDAWAKEHGALDVNDDWADEGNRHVYSEFAVLTKRIEFDCVIPLGEPGHGCVTVITQQRLPENLFAPPNFTAVGVGFLHMGKGGQYESGEELFPGLSFIPGIVVNTTASVNSASTTITYASTHSGGGGQTRATATATTTAGPMRGERRETSASGRKGGVFASGVTLLVALTNQPAASFAGCVFVQSYGTPLYSAPRTRMLWVLDSVIWESFGGGVRLDGGGNGTRIEGVLIAGTRYYRRDVVVNMTAPASLKDPLVATAEQQTTSGRSLPSVLSLDAIGPVTSLCSLVANYTDDVDDGDEEEAGLTDSTANYDDTAFYEPPVANGDDTSVITPVPLPSSVIARRNVLAGSESEGLCIPYERSRAFSSNIIHSSFVGVFFFRSGMDTASSSGGGIGGVNSTTTATPASYSDVFRNAVVYGLRSYLNRYIGVYSTSHQQLTLHGASVFANSVGVVLGIDPTFHSGTSTVANSFVSGFSNCKYAVHEDGGAVCQSSMAAAPAQGCEPGTFPEGTADHAAVLAIPSFLRVGLSYSRSDPLAVLGGARRGYREVFTQGSMRLVNVTFGGVGLLACPSLASGMLHGAAVAGSGSAPTAGSLASITTSGVVFTNYPSWDSLEVGEDERIKKPVTPQMSLAWILRLSVLNSHMDHFTPYDETIVRDLDGSLYTGIGRRPDVTNPSAIFSSLDNGDGVPIAVEPAVYGASFSTLIDTAGCAVFLADPTVLRCADLHAPFQQLILQSLDNRQGALDNVALTLPTVPFPIRFRSSAAATVASAKATAAELKPSSLVAIKSIATPPYITSTVTSPTPVAVQVDFAYESSPDVFLVGVHSCIWALNSDEVSTDVQEALLVDGEGTSFASGFLYVTTTLMDPHKRLTVWRDGSVLEPSDSVLLPVDRQEAATTSGGDEGDSSSSIGGSGGDSTSPTSPSTSSSAFSSTYLSSGIAWSTVTTTDGSTGQVARKLQLRIGCGTQATIHQLAYGIISLYIPQSSSEVQNGLVRLIVAALAASAQHSDKVVTASKMSTATHSPATTSSARQTSMREGTAAAIDFAVEEGSSFFLQLRPSRESSLSPDASERQAAVTSVPSAAGTFNITLESMLPDIYNRQRTFLSLRVEGSDSADYDAVTATNDINSLLTALEETDVAATDGAEAMSLPSKGTLTGSGLWYAVLSVQRAVAPKQLYEDTQSLHTILSSRNAQWHEWRLVVFVVLLPAVLLLALSVRCAKRVLQRRFHSFFSLLEATGGSQQLLALVQRYKEKAEAAKRGKGGEGTSSTPSGAVAAGQVQRVVKTLPDSGDLPTEETEPATGTAAAISRYVARWSLTRESLADMTAANACSGAGITTGTTTATTNSSSVRVGQQLVTTDANGEGSLFPVIALSASLHEAEDASFRLGWPRRTGDGDGALLLTPQRAMAGIGDSWSAVESVSRTSNGTNVPGTSATPGSETIASHVPSTGPPSSSARRDGSSKRRGTRRAQQKRQQRDAPIPVALPQHQQQQQRQPLSYGTSPLNVHASVASAAATGGNGGSARHASFAEGNDAHSSSTSGGTRVSFAPQPPRRLSPITSFATLPPAALIPVVGSGGDGEGGGVAEASGGSDAPVSRLAATTASAATTATASQQTAPPVIPSLLVRRPVVNRSGVAPPSHLGGGSSNAPLLALPSVADGGESASIATVPVVYYPPAVFQGGYGMSENLSRPVLLEERMGAVVAAPSGPVGSGVRGRRQVSFAAIEDEGEYLGPQHNENDNGRGGQGHYYYYDDQ